MCFNNEKVCNFALDFDRQSKRIKADRKWFGSGTKHIDLPVTEREKGGDALKQREAQRDRREK